MRPHRSTVFSHNEWNTLCSICDTSTFYALEIVKANFYILNMRYKHSFWKKKRFFGLFSGFGDICPCVQCCVFFYKHFLVKSCKGRSHFDKFSQTFQENRSQSLKIIVNILFFFRASSMVSTSHFGSSVKTSTVLTFET